MSVKPDTGKQHLDSVSHQKTEREEELTLGGADVEEVVELRKETRPYFIVYMYDIFRGKKRLSDILW